MTAGVLPSSVPNAFALPGGKVFVLNALLEKADSPDEIAGVLAHELGHLKHHDNMRGLIYNGGTSFLIGLLFGDVTGSSARDLRLAHRWSKPPIRARPRQMPTPSRSTSCTSSAARRSRWPSCCSASPARKADQAVTILASHPLTEDRLARMSERRPPRQRPAAADGHGVAGAEGHLRQRQDLTQVRIRRLPRRRSP